MDKKPKRAPEDEALWRRVQETVKPLLRRQPPPVAGPIRLPPRPDTAAARPVARGAAPRPVGPPPRPAPEIRPGQAVDIDRSTHDKLKRGQLSIDAKLDLHGMNRETAHRALDGFLGRAHAQGRRCCLVVTGKSGVLKSDTPRWLNERPNRARILAVATAQPRHGGGGALYVLLKRQRGEA